MVKMVKMGKRKGREEEEKRKRWGKIMNSEMIIKGKSEIK
jgi:hypothetical protein